MHDALKNNNAATGSCHSIKAKKELSPILKTKETKSLEKLRDLKALKTT